MVRKIKNILVPLDGSKNSLRGLDEAIYLARQCQATITGIYIHHMPAIYSIHPIAFLGIKTTKIKKFLDSAKTRAAKQGIVFKSKIISGVPGYDIVEFSKKGKKFDLIVIGARGMGSVKEAFLGSVSNYVIHKSKIPVVIVK